MGLRQPVQTGTRSKSASYSFSPAVRGWVATELANAKPGGALQMENFFPTRTGCRVRGGCLKYATISSSPVLRMWTFKAGQVEEFFASDETSIFNITTVADPDVIPAAAVSGRTSGYYSTAQTSNAASDSYLYAVNGTDSALLYDGSTWTTVTAVSSPAITGVTTSSLSFVWSFASRLFFIEKNTLSVWYLPVDSIGGAAQEFSLAGIFQKGGSLLFGGKWSLDSGDGLDDKCVFVSTEGEVAVYQGTNPSSAADWQKVGVYQITPPLGANATMQAGGDLLIAVQDGIVPISEAVNKDVAALSLSAITVDIEPAWKREVIARQLIPWEIIKWPTNNMMVVSLPVVSDGQATLCYVKNLETGSWGYYTGWDTRCLGLFANQGYYGNNSGTVHAMEVTGTDDGELYTCTYVGLPDHIKTPGATKVVHSARATFQSNIPFTPKISVSTNYQVRLPSAPSSTSDLVSDLWDVGLWDVAMWDGGSAMTVSTKWVSVGKTGFVISPQVQITCGTTPRPTTELIAFDVIYERAGTMV
jgi:hypothetical protein